MNLILRYIQLDIALLLGDICKNFMLNFQLIFSYIVPSLIGSTILSIVMALAIGSIIGLIIGLIKKRNKQVITTAIIGAIMGGFFGIMFVCMIPTFSAPGLVQSWGLGGGLGSLPVLLMVMTLGPIGGILGAVTGSTFGLKFLQRLTSQRFLMILAATYALMTISIYVSFALQCSKPVSGIWYCKNVGF